MADTLIAAGRVVPACDENVLAPGYVRLRDGVVAEVAAGRPAGQVDFDLADGVLVPGFVDLQVNGCFGVDLCAVDLAGWATVVARLPETGTTAFLPTLITGPVHKLAAALRAAADMQSLLPFGARVLGVHLEGPFVSLRHRGAHPPEWISDPQPEMIGELLDADSGVLRIVTLAPERYGAIAAIERLTATGVLVSVGHSDASAAQVAAAADAGARMVTHLFNAQTGIHHRSPGVAAQALADGRLTSGLIADLHHVAAPVCAIALAAAPGRIALVTDSVAYAGMRAGRYQLGGRPIRLPPGDGVPPVRADGTLAGSALRMDRAVSNLAGIGVDLVTAVTAATRVPADLVGRPDLGRIASGAAADLAWLGDDLRTRATWIAGEIAYWSGPGSTRRHSPQSYVRVAPSHHTVAARGGPVAS